MEIPPAIVLFDRAPVTGEQLAALVQHAAEQNEYGKFVISYQSDLMSFGQTSRYPEEHIRVLPSLDVSSVFHPAEKYSEAIIWHREWSAETYAGLYDQQSVVDAITAFTARLVAAYKEALVNGFQQFTYPPR